MPKKRKVVKASVKTRLKTKPTPQHSPNLSAINKKLDMVVAAQQRILANQQKMFHEETKVEKEEEKIETLSLHEEKEEEKLEEVTQKELGEIEQLKALEQSIQRDVKAHPLRKITIRDFTKGMIGAFVGIVAHFSFLEGMHIAENFDMFRATLLYITSFFIGIAFLYFSGFRSVGDKLILKFIPLRIFVIYITALVVIVIVLWLFGAITWATQFEEVYKTVSAISILAILGACTADLIGKEH